MVTMSYTIEKKVGSRIYLYEVEGYWDKEKKQSRQKRKYIGRKNPDTNEIIKRKPQVEVKMVFEYGGIYFTEQLIKSCGIRDFIVSNFSDLSDLLEKIIVFQVTESEPLYLFESWCDSVLELSDKVATSQKISRIMKKIGEMESNRENFFVSWNEKQKDTKGLFFDITSFSSYSNLIDIVEWGYNRDGDKLPQINFGMLMGYPSKLPLLYSIYQGSISDVSTIKNISAKLDALNLKKITLILDRGFYSQYNIVEIYNSFENFVIPMTFTTVLSKNILLMSKDISRADNLFCINKRAVFYQNHKAEISGKQIYAHVYLDEERRAREIKTLVSKLFEIQQNLNKQIFNSKEEADEHLKLNYSGHRKYFLIDQTSENICFKRNNATVSSMIERMGKTILITKKNLPKEKVLDLYLNRESVEHCFDILKNELHQDRLRVKGRKTLEGRLFVMFLSVIIHTHITNIMKEKNLFKTFTLKELLKEMKKMKMVKMVNGKTYITEISKKQKLILKAFGIKQPDGGAAK